MKSAGSIVVTYIDPFNEFASVAHLLLKILSSLEWLSDVPVVGDAPHQLSDSIGLWEESTRVDDAFLCLFIGRSADDAECVSWVQQARRRNAGFLILTLSGGISGSVGTIPKATSQWNGLASALWRRARSQPSLSDDLLPVEGVDSSYVVPLHPTHQGPNRDRPSFRNREAKALSAAIARELAAGFRRRLLVGKDLVRLYSMCSMWSAALIVLDQQETVAIAAKQRCRNCGVYLLSPDSTCAFHSGHFSGAGRYSVARWTCCSNPDERATPCVTNERHELEALPFLAISSAPVSGLLVDLLPDASFRPLTVSPGARVLEASSYSEPSRQQLLAQQCHVLARMKDGARIARRVLRFVQMAWRCASPLLRPLELVAWTYCICSEAAEMCKQIGTLDVLPRLLQVMRVNLVAIGTSVVEESSCSELVVAHAVLSRVFRYEEVFVAELTVLLSKEQMIWSKLGLMRHDAVAALQTGLVLFSLEHFEVAYAMIRSVHLRFEGWTDVFSRAVHVMSACEERLGLSSVATTLLLAQTDVGAVKRLLLLTAPGQPLAVKVLEPHFSVTCGLDLEGRVCVTAVCNWALSVRPDLVEVELQCAGSPMRVVVRSDEPTPTKVPLMRGAWFLRKVVCCVGTLRLIRLSEDDNATVLPVTRPALPSHKPLLPGDHCVVHAKLMHTPLVGLPLVLSLSCDEPLSQVNIWVTCNKRSLVDPAVVADSSVFDRVVLPVVGLGLGLHAIELIMACRAEPNGAARPAFVFLEKVAVERPLLHRVSVAWANSLYFVAIELVCHSEVELRKVILDQVPVVISGSVEKRFWFGVSPSILASLEMSIGDLFVNVEYVYAGDIVFVSRLHLDTRSAACEELSWLLPLAFSASLSVVNVYGNGMTSDSMVTLLSSFKYRASAQSLTQLDLGRNNLAGSATVVAALAGLLTTATNLTSLRLWDTRLGVMQLEAILTAIGQSKKLTELDLGKNEIGTEGFGLVGDFLGADPPLKTLSLWYNIGGDAGARILMKSLLSNYTLSSLDLRDNRISDAGVAEVVDMLRRNLVLTTLKLQDNELGEEGILALSHALHDNYVLESLEIVDNPASLVAALPHLERISFGVKRNRSFSDQRFGKAFAASNMGLIHVPPQLFSLTTLQALDLSHNRFSTFPDSITVLRSLERLSFAHNSLSQFPSYCCSSFARLHTLDLSHNRLVTFPAESAAMTALRVLHLDSNALETLPASLGRVEWESLRVEGNPLSCVPPSTVAKGSRAVLYFLKDLVTGGGDYCYRVKLLVTGQANVGKTSLLAALKNEVGNVNKVLRLLTGKGRRSSTLGISLDDWRPLDSLITFSTWDFGGQLVYYATHQFFLSKRSLYLLVFSLATGLSHNRLLSWLNSIQARAPGVSVLLVGTHLDDKRVRRAPSHLSDMAAALRRTLSNWERAFAPAERLRIVKCTEEQWFFPVSAITGEGVLELKQVLMNTAADQPSLRERVPRIYLQLLDVVRLRRRTENIPITSWERFREWAGFEDEAQLERAVQLLHDWGELLWFCESATLRSVVILSPQWLTRMFATIVAPSATQPDEEDSLHSPHSSAAEETSDVELNVSLPSASASQMQQPGIIDRTSLPALWHEYDPAHYDYFEKLLETFELWIPIENGDRFIVPVLLPRRDVELDCGLDWSLVQYGRCFWCPFPLHGLFERCVVQLLRLFSPVKYWRNEVLLAGPNSLRILATIAPFAMPNHPHGERLCFFFAAEPDTATLAELRNAVSSTTFIVHNYLMDWYNTSLREQVIAEALCPRCCSVRGVGGTFPLEDLLRDQNRQEHVCVVCAARHELSSLVVELTDAAVHASGEYAVEMEELRHVADGSCSRVFQGRFRGKQICAVKKLRVHAITSTWFLEFLQEINILQLLRHPSVVSIERAYLRPLCIVLEWIGAGTLDLAIARFDGPHNWPLLVRVLDDIAQGLHYLHTLPGAPVFHRDLKSMNILVVELSLEIRPVAVKIGDLGSSCRSLGKVSGNIVHNPRWKPPELFASSAVYTSSSDVYCFGMIMWELVGRSLPFAELVWPSLIEDKIIRGVRPVVPEETRSDYARLMSRCWSQLPEERPTSLEVIGSIESMRALV